MDMGAHHNNSISTDKRNRAIQLQIRRLLWVSKDCRGRHVIVFFKWSNKVVTHETLDTSSTAPSTVSSSATNNKC